MLSQRQKTIRNIIVYSLFILLTIIIAAIFDNLNYLKLSGVFALFVAYYVYRLIRKKDSTEKPKDKLKRQLEKTEIGRKTIKKVEESSAEKKITERKLRKAAYKEYINSVEDEFSDDIFDDAYNKEDND